MSDLDPILHLRRQLVDAAVELIHLKQRLLEAAQRLPVDAHGDAMADDRLPHSLPFALAGIIENVCDEGLAEAADQLLDAARWDQRSLRRRFLHQQERSNDGGDHG